MNETKLCCFLMNPDEPLQTRQHSIHVRPRVCRRPTTAAPTIRQLCNTTSSSSSSYNIRHRRERCCIQDLQHPTIDGIARSAIQRPVRAARTHRWWVQCRCLSTTTIRNPAVEWRANSASSSSPLVMGPATAVHIYTSLRILTWFPRWVAVWQRPIRRWWPDQCHSSSSRRWHLHTAINWYVLRHDAPTLVNVLSLEREPSWTVCFVIVIDDYGVHSEPQLIV